MLVKRCTKCNVMKPPSAYHKKNGKYWSYCKQCVAKAANKYYHAVTKPKREQQQEATQ